MLDLEPHLQKLVVDFESSLSTPSSYVPVQFNDIKSELKKSGHDLLDLLSENSRRIVLTATALFGRASRYYVELQNCPWKLDVDKLRHDFDDQAVLSRDFIVYIFKIQHAIADAAWPDVLSKIVAARDERRKKPRARISNSRAWAPKDVLDAARALGLDLTPYSKCGRARSASVASSTHPGHPQRRFRLSTLPTSSPSTIRTLSPPATRAPSPPERIPSLSPPARRTPSPSEERRRDLGGRLSTIPEATSPASNDDAASEVSVELPRHEDAETLLGADEYSFEVAPDNSTIQICNKGDGLFKTDFAEPPPFVTIERPSKRKRGSEMVEEDTAVNEDTAPEEPPMNETDTAIDQLGGRNCVGQSAIHSVLDAFALSNVRVIELAKNPLQSWASWAKDHHYSLDEEQDMILIPLHLPRRSHWVLLHGDVARRKFTAYDSLRAPSEDHDISNAIQPICRALGHAPDAAWCFELDAHGPQQPNGYDCGVFVMVSGLYLMAHRTLPRHIHGAAWRYLLRHFLSQQDNDDDADMDVDALLQPEQQRLPQSRRPGQLAKELKQAHEQINQVADTAREACLVVEQLSARMSKDNRAVMAELLSVEKRSRSRNVLLRQLEDSLATDPFNGMAAAVDAARVALEDAELRQARLKGALRRQHRVAAFHGALTALDGRLSGEALRFETELQAGVDELQEFLTSLKR